MERVSEFEKVSFEQFYKAVTDFYDEEQARLLYESLQLPTRATSGSAGYDFHAPFSFVLPAGKSILIPTGIRAKIEDGWFLGIFPRSSLGFKYNAMFANTIPVVDSDYYGSDNEGHIFLSIVNRSKNKSEMSIVAGDKLAQGVFIPFGITQSDDVIAQRNGGIGSTGA